MLFVSLGSLNNASSDIKLKDNVKYVVLQKEKAINLAHISPPNQKERNNAFIST